VLLLIKEKAAAKGRLFAQRACSVLRVVSKLCVRGGRGMAGRAPYNILACIKRARELIYARDRLAGEQTKHLRQQRGQIFDALTSIIACSPNWIVTNFAFEYKTSSGLNSNNTIKELRA